MTETYRNDRPGDSVTDKLDKSARTRVIIWNGGLQMVKDNPFFGVGYGQFPNLIGNYAPEVAGMDPHNNYLKIAAEMGVPALVSFVALIVLCFWRGYRIYGKVTDPFTKALLLGYIGSVAGLFVANIFGSRLDSEEITTQFWAMTGGVALLGRLPEDEKVEGEDGDAPESEE
jgi:O-antigen ligase